MNHHAPSLEPVASEAWHYIRPALIEHLWHWWGTDALFHAEILRSDQTVCPSTLRRIASAYGVSRGLLQGKEAEAAELLDERLPDWPSGLTERADFVQQVAIEAEQRGLTKGKLLSAFSKIVWFARPSGWTMYDSFARRGLNSKRRYQEFDEYQSYYLRLSDRGFDEAMETGRSVIEASEINYLWPERILDKYLMLVGHSAQENLTVVNTSSHNAILRLWDDFFGPEVRRNIDQISIDLATNLCDEPIFQAHTLQPIQHPKPPS